MAYELMTRDADIARRLGQCKVDFKSPASMAYQVLYLAGLLGEVRLGFTRHFRWRGRLAKAFSEIPLVSKTARKQQWTITVGNKWYNTDMLLKGIESIPADIRAHTVASYLEYLEDHPVPMTLLEFFVASSGTAATASSVTSLKPAA